MFALFEGLLLVVTDKQVEFGQNQPAQLPMSNELCVCPLTEQGVTVICLMETHSNDDCKKTRGAFHYRFRFSEILLVEWNISLNLEITRSDLLHTAC